MGWTTLNAGIPLSRVNDTGNVELITIDPWDTKSGNDDNVSPLSFVSAVDVLITQYGDSAHAAFAIAITSGSFSGLADQADSLAAIFPMPYFSKIARLARQADGLRDSRMLLVDHEKPIMQLNLATLPSILAIKKAELCQLAQANALSHLSTSPITNLTAFVSEKLAFDAAVDGLRDAAMANLSGGVGFRFYSEGNVVNDLIKGIPGYDMSYTACCMFVGSPEQLSFLVEIFP